MTEREFTFIFTVYLCLVEAALDDPACLGHASPSERLSLDAPNAPPLPPPRHRGKVRRRLVRFVEPQLVQPYEKCVCKVCVRGWVWVWVGMVWCVLNWGLRMISLICSGVDPVLSIAGAIVFSK